MIDNDRVQQLVEAYLRVDQPLDRYLASLDEEVRRDVAQALTVILSDEPQLQVAVTTARPNSIAGCTVLERIGVGAMGEVFRAHQAELDRMVAMKLMRAELAGRQDYMARFRSESRLLASLDHPGIVKVLMSGEHDGWLFFAMELVEGRDLAWALPAMREAMAECTTGRRYDRIVRIAAEMLDALSHAHRRGVVHRDLKPSNVVLDGDDRPHIVDFGLAKSSDSAGQTTLGMVVGTPAYMSPEVAAGTAHPREQIDLWAVGAMLFEALVGRPPYERGSLDQTVTALRSPLRIDPRTFEPALPKSLAAIVSRALSPNWQERYGSANLFAQDLRNFLDDQPVLAAKFSPFVALRHHMRRRRRRYLALAGATMAACTAWISANVVAGERRAAAEVSAVLSDIEAPNWPLEELARRAGAARELLASSRLGARDRARVLAALQQFEATAGELHAAACALVVRGAGSAKGTPLPDYRAPTPAVMLAGLHAAAEARLVVPELRSPEELLISTQPQVTVEDPAGASGVPLRIQVLDDITGRALLEIETGQTPWQGTLPPGRYRITVGTLAAFAECSRTFWQPGEHVVTPILRATPAVMAGMSTIDAGTAVIDQDLPGASVYGQKTITFDGFCIDRTEVTCGVYHQYCVATGATLPRTWPDGYNPAWQDLPVVGVTFGEAAACAEWLGKRLPSWAEWQIAARGLMGSLYPWGNDPAPIATLPTLGRPGPWHQGVRAVGTTPLDESWCGAFDMLANVDEWTDTPFVAMFEGVPFPVHPWRVRAGAPWFAKADPAFVALHDVAPGPPQVRETGFRCAKSILP